MSFIKQPLVDSASVSFHINIIFTT